MNSNITCDLCGDTTEEETSKVYELYWGDGLTHERHCDDCDAQPTEEVA